MGHMDLICPYCGFVVARSVKLVGQRVLCPNCHGMSTAAGSKSLARANARSLVILVILAVFIWVIVILNWR